MRIVEVTAFGGPEVLEVKQAADPVPAAGQVVVAVVASGVLSVDAMIRSGRGGDYFPVQPPYVPGAGVAGVVKEVGEGVDNGWIGRRVLANLDGGGYATHVVTPVDNLIDVPDALGLPEAMTMLHDGSTALGVFETTPVEAGETVLVQPAAGGLGVLLVQLLVAAGAKVIGVAHGSEKLNLVKELGADVVIDYGQPDWTAQVGTVDVAFDGVGGEPGRNAFDAVRQGGRYSNYGNASGTFNPITPEEAAQRGITIRGMEQLPTFHAAKNRRVEEMLKLAAAGRIRTVIGRTFPLDQAADAHRALEARTITGKALLIP